MEGKTKLLYLFDEREKGRDPFEAIEEWDEAHPLPDDLYPTEQECWAFLALLRERGSLTASEVTTLRFAVHDLQAKSRSERLKDSLR